MAGFDNDCMYADNADFTTAGAGGGSSTNGLQTNGQLWIGTTAVNVGGTHINVGSLTSPNSSVTIGYSSPNITLSAGGALATTYTENSGVATPSANNLNVVGTNSALTGYSPWTTGAAATLTLNMPGTVKWVVNATANLGTHTTIASAITAASSGDDIFITPGTYTENLTLKAGVNLIAYTGDGDTPNVSIVGKLTFTTAGTVTISNIRLTTNSDNCIAVTGSAASILKLKNCYINCSNNTGITFSSSSSSAQINLLYCNGNLGTTGIAYFAHSSAGVLTIWHCEMSNTGGAVTANTCSAGQVDLECSIFPSPITTSSTGFVTGSGNIISVTNATCLTIGGATNGGLFSTYINSGTASAVSVGAAGFFLISCNIISSNTNAVTGAGTVTLGGNVFGGSSSNVNTTTIAYYNEGPSTVIGSANSGGTNSLTITNSSNTASSAAKQSISVGGGTADDAFTTYTVSGVTNWSQGVDNSDSDAYVLAASTALGTTNVIHAATGGQINYPLQPAFLATASTQTDVTGDNTSYTVLFATEIFDQGNNYSSPTFTAPVTGRYYLSTGVTGQQFTASFTSLELAIVTSNRAYDVVLCNPGAIRQAANLVDVNGSVLADMDVADTATIAYIIAGSTKTIDVIAISYFCGQLLA